jgi:hypothetical protein
MKTKNLDTLVKKIIEESLEEKADDLVSKIKTKMNEWNPQEPLTLSGVDVHEEMEEDEVDDESTCKYHMETFGPDDERTKRFCKSTGEEMSEEMDEEMDEDVCEQCGGMMREGECMECGYGGMKEAETDEGNAFTGALAKAKKEGQKEFEVDGKKYSVKEAKEKWIQKTDMKKGTLHKKLGVPEGENISVEKLKSIKKRLMKKGEGDKKLSKEDSKLLKQVNLALTLKDIKESKKQTLRLTESEMIELIEKIISEQKKPKGMSETEKVLNADKKENTQYLKDVTKKMKDYTKKGSNGEYTMEPKMFPKGNGELKKDNSIKKYNPSEAVEEYIDAFSHPGMTNLVFDEIKPDDKKIEKYLKGDSTTGNAQVDKEGKAYGNVVPSKVGDKFAKNYKDNLYGQEQMKASYKRQPQPVDQAGETTQRGSLKAKKGQKTSQEVLNKLEESKQEESKVLNEEFSKMKHLMGYNKKTQ